jgi:hypothetical protein
MVMIANQKQNNQNNENDNDKHERPGGCEQGPPG